LAIFIEFKRGDPYDFHSQDNKERVKLSFCSRAKNLLPFPTYFSHFLRIVKFVLLLLTASSEFVSNHALSK